MIINGNSFLAFMNNQIIGCSTSATFNSTNEEIDVTCKDNNGTRQVLSGSNQWSIEVAGLWDVDSTLGPEHLLAAHKNKVRVGIKMAVDTPGYTHISGYAYINTLNIESPLNGGVTYSATFTGDGEWNYGTNT